MNLAETLDAFASFLRLDADKLVTYAIIDDLGGFHTDPAQAKFPVGSLWDVEGRILYALVRALKPSLIVELGVNAGASTSHLRLAVKHNRAGKVMSVDRWGGAGTSIPDHLSAYGELVFTDAFAFIDTLAENSVDFVYEDLCHEHNEVARIIAALRPKLISGAVVVHHDSEHGVEGIEVRQGIQTAGVKRYLSLLTEPSDCGLAVWSG